MTLTIGRAAVDNPEKVSSSGGRITLEGDIAPANGTDAANVDEFLARRQQLVAMVDNPDMDVWPVTWSEDDTLNGFYRVRRAEVDPASVYLATGVGRYRVELERPTGLVSPLVECTTLALVMDNWLRTHRDLAGEPLFEDVRARLIERFYPSSPAWRESVLEQSRAIYAEAIAGVANWR